MSKGLGMKKIVIMMCLAVFLIGGNIRPAHALIVDVTQIATKVSDWVQKIKDSVSKVTQQVKQIELTARQGFNLDTVRQMAKDYFTKYLNSQFSYLDKRLFTLVAATKGKQLEAREKRRELYHEAVNKLIDEKKKIIAENERKASQDGDLLMSVELDLKAKCGEGGSLVVAYENSENPEEKDRIYKELTECQSNLEKVQREKHDMYMLRDNSKYQHEEKLAEEKELLEQGDETEKDYIRQKKEDEAQQDNTTLVQRETPQNEEWDTEGNAKDYSPTAEEYEKFINDYFYDPASLTDTSPQINDTPSNENNIDGYSRKAVVYQSNVARVMRNRKYLFVNTAVHLMQVATSVRREIPLRAKAIKDIKETPSNGELEAMVNYSAARIESARSLLLYSKLLAAKLQYLAGRDILQSKPQKEIEGKDFGSSDLGKYILDTDYLKKIVKEYE